MREFVVTYKIMIPDSIRIFGVQCDADDSVDENIHYFFHPDSNPDNDMDMTIDHNGDITLIIGDEVMGSWRLHTPQTWEGQDTNIDIINDAIKMAEEIYADLDVKPSLA